VFTLGPGACVTTQRSRDFALPLSREECKAGEEPGRLLNCLSIAVKQPNNDSSS
jgi:hypothetical protein